MTKNIKWFLQAGTIIALLLTLLVLPGLVGGSGDPLVPSTGTWDVHCNSTMYVGAMYRHEVVVTQHSLTTGVPTASRWCLDEDGLFKVIEAKPYTKKAGQYWMVDTSYIDQIVVLEEWFKL